MLTLPQPKAATKSASAPEPNAEKASEQPPDEAKSMSFVCSMCHVATHTVVLDASGSMVLLVDLAVDFQYLLQQLVDFVGSD